MTRGIGASTTDLHRVHPGRRCDGLRASATQPEHQRVHHRRQRLLRGLGLRRVRPEGLREQRSWWSELRPASLRPRPRASTPPHAHRQVRRSHHRRGPAGRDPRGYPFQWTNLAPRALDGGTGATSLGSSARAPPARVRHEQVRRARFGRLRVHRRMRLRKRARPPTPRLRCANRTSASPARRPRPPPSRRKAKGAVARSVGGKAPRSRGSGWGSRPSLRSAGGA